MTTALLHNCEAFGEKVPDGLESLYFTLIKSSLGVRKSTANDLVLVEAGLIDLKAMIHYNMVSCTGVTSTDLKMHWISVISIVGVTA